MTGGPVDRQRYRECAAVVKFRRHRHGTTESAHQGADVGKADALSWSVLGSGAAEQLEDTPMIPGVDTPAIVGDFKNRKAELGPAADRDVAGHAGFEIFQRIVDQV